MSITLEPLSSAAVYAVHMAFTKLKQPAADTACTRRTIRPLLCWLLLGVIAAGAVYELTQYALGACQGYSGVAAAGRSIAAHLGVWSIDPLTCLQSTI